MMVLISGYRYPGTPWFILLSLTRFKSMGFHFKTEPGLLFKKDP